MAAVSAWRFMLPTTTQRMTKSANSKLLKSQKGRIWHTGFIVSSISVCLDQLIERAGGLHATTAVIVGTGRGWGLPWLVAAATDAVCVTSCPVLPPPTPYLHGVLLWSKMLLLYMAFDLSSLVFQPTISGTQALTSELILWYNTNLT